MLDWPNQVENGANLEFDVCIAGAGAAGITLALELENSGLSVCLLEGGGLQAPRISVDHPYNGESVGRNYNLLTTRLRYLGGSTNHWGGWCRPLDPLDFASRPGIPLSGWPLDRAELDPFYKRASAICEINPPGFEVNELPATGDSQTEYFSHYDADFTTKNFRLEPPTRFGSRYLPELKNSRVTTCFLDSTVVEIQTRGSRVTALRVHSTGKEFSVRAKVFVLALGGIENARLLLHSDREHSRGIGNQSDFVGRCFADHLGITIGRVLASEQAPYVPQNVNGIQILPHLSLTDELLVQHQLINFGITFLNVQSRAIPLMGVDYLSAPLFSREWEGSPRTRLYHLLVRLEPLPDPESRLSLSRQKDSYGVRRVRLDWKVHGLEFECLERILDLVARKIGAANLGRVLQIFQNRLIDREILGTYQSHHLGTTRMARNPDQGVVNVDGKVHSMENLYIAGSSVFPTFGFANPTLTIVALTVRLASHLRSRLASTF